MRFAYDVQAGQTIGIEHGIQHGNYRCLDEECRGVVHFSLCAEQKLQRGGHSAKRAKTTMNQDDPKPRRSFFAHNNRTEEESCRGRGGESDLHIEVKEHIWKYLHDY